MRWYIVSGRIDQPYIKLTLMAVGGSSVKEFKSRPIEASSPESAIDILWDELDAIHKQDRQRMKKVMDALEIEVNDRDDKTNDDELGVIVVSCKPIDKAIWTAAEVSEDEARKITETLNKKVLVV